MLGAIASVLVGEPGIGKTALWRWAVQRANRLGYAVLVSRPVEAETAYSYAGLADLLSMVDDETLATIPSPQLSALRVALLREEPGDTPPDSRTIATAYLSLLTRLAEVSPVVVAIDDVEWLDEPTRDVVAFAAHRLGEHQVGILSTRRSDGGGTGSIATAAEEERQIVVSEMTVAELHHLLRSHVGVSMSHAALVRLHDVTRGNPLFAIEVSRELVRQGVDLRAANLPPVPSTLQTLLTRRLRDAPEATIRVLVVVAALARPSLATIERALPGEDVLSALDSSERAGIVTLDGDELRFTHPLLAAAVYGGASSADRRAAHRALASAVADDEERARQASLAATRPDAGVAAQLEAASDTTKRRGSPLAAAELLEASLRLTPDSDPDARGRRSLALGLALFEAGDADPAVTVLEHAIPLMTGAVRGEARMLLGTIRWYDDPAAAAALLGAALDDARGDYRLAGNLHARLSLFTDDLREAMGHADAAVSLLEQVEEPALLAFALFERFYRHVLMGEPPDQASFDRALRLEGRGDAWEISTLPGIWWKCTDHFDLARDRFQAMLGWSRDAGDESSSVELLAHLVELELWTGDWEAADRHANECLDLAPEVGQESWAERAHALVDVHLGRPEAVPVAERHAEERDAAGDVWDVAAWLSILGFAHLSMGRPRDAATALSRCRDRLTGIGVQHPLRLRFEADLIEALIAAGDLETANDILVEYEEHAGTVPRPSADAGVLRCQALLDAARGRWESALGRADSIDAVLARVEMPLEVARCRLAFGVILRRSKRRGAAASLLGQAKETFDGLGAAAWGRLAEAEIDRLGLRRSEDELTPTELRIAELVASGRKNREVAEALFISPKTVEANLARVYRKFGIGSRAELGRVIAERDADRST